MLNSTYGTLFCVGCSNHYGSYGDLLLCISGKVTSAGMYFLHIQVYRMDSTINALAAAKDPESAFFKRLEGLQPCDVSELKAGTHLFAVYDIFQVITSLRLHLTGLRHSVPRPVRRQHKS